MSTICVHRLVSVWLNENVAGESREYRWPRKSTAKRRGKKSMIEDHSGIFCLIFSGHFGKNLMFQSMRPYASKTNPIST